MRKSLQQKQIVILDRDGVINQDSADYIKHPDEWHPIDGSLKAIALLHQHGLDVHIATNQAGIARGKLSLSLLEAIHEKMMAAIHQAGGEIKSLQFCPHHPDEHCHCRKPAPGMLLNIANQYGPELKPSDLAEFSYVGDSLKDIEAAEAAGILPVLVLSGNGQKTRSQRPTLASVFDNLLAFAEYKISP